MKVLVTGGSGYLGSILCEHLLQAGHEVTVYDSLMYGQPSLFHCCENPKFDFVFGDVRDAKALKPLIQKADVIIPLAAIVGEPACKRDPWQATSVNLDAIVTINLLRSQDQLVIYPNTNSGYGVKSTDSHCTEDSPLEPISHYGQTKVKAEQELMQSPNTICFRLATVFGMSPRMRLDLLVNNFVYDSLKYGYIVVFQKDFMRNYVHIRDVADGFLYAIANCAKMVGRVFNMGLDSANLSKAQLVHKIKEHLPNLSITFAEIGEDPDKRNYIVSNERLRQAGFEARRSIDAGIAELLKGYRMMGRQPFKNI